MDFDEDHKHISSNEDQSSKDDVEVCDNCGEGFDSDCDFDGKAELPCKCCLHEYSCLMKRNKNAKCTGCGHCICDDCIRLWRKVKELESKLAKQQETIDALQKTMNELSNPKKKLKS